MRRTHAAYSSAPLTGARVHAPPAAQDRSLTGDCPGGWGEGVPREYVGRRAAVLAALGGDEAAHAAGEVAALVVEARAVHRLRRQAQREGALGAGGEVRERDEPRARRRLLRRRPRVHHAPAPRRRRGRLALPRGAAVEGRPVVVLAPRLRRLRLILRPDSGRLLPTRLRLRLRRLRLAEGRLQRQVRVVPPPRHGCRSPRRAPCAWRADGRGRVGGGGRERARDVGVVALDGPGADEPDGALHDAQAHEERQDAVLRAPVDLVANYLAKRRRLQLPTFHKFQAHAYLRGQVHDLDV
jgi:hypothetical protein